jgi:hypothetical protein
MTGMDNKAAFRLGIFALAMIFQPFSLTLFAIGSGCVVLAGLLNNLLPMAQPGVPARSVLIATLIVVMIFCIVLLIAIAAAHGYGVFFLNPPDPNTVTGKAALGIAPFYRQPLVWILAAVAAALALVITMLVRKRA